MSEETEKSEIEELVGYLYALDDMIAAETDYQVLGDLKQNHDAAEKRLRQLQEDEGIISP